MMYLQPVVVCGMVCHTNQADCRCNRHCWEVVCWQPGSYMRPQQPLSTHHHQQRLHCITSVTDTPEEQVVVRLAAHGRALAPRTCHHVVTKVGAHPPVALGPLCVCDTVGEQSAIRKQMTPQHRVMIDGRTLARCPPSLPVWLSMGAVAPSLLAGSRRCCCWYCC